MELRVLRYFLMAAREENMTKAAELLHVTQPTLSRQIMQLEEELGCKLFRRSNHSIYLTEEGMLLRKRAQDMIALEERTAREFRNLQEEIAGEITIGSGETRGVSEITDVMAKFQKEYPLVRYEIYTANADDIKERLDRGLVDFGLLMEPVDISRYNFLRLKQKERWGIVVRDDSPLAGRERVTAEDLLSVPLISVKRTLVKKELEGWFGELYDQVQIAAIYNLVNNGIEMVRSGIGALLCFPIQTLDPGLKFIPLYPQVETGSVLVWRKNQVLSQTAYRFLEEFKKCATGISDDKN